MLLKPEVIERAVDLQQRSYVLLQWIVTRVDHGSLTYRTAHDLSSLPAAAHDWLERNYETLPSKVQPAREDLRPFANLFASYLESSFDLLEEPGQQKVSPRHHCFCPICSWFVAAPRLRTKKLTRHDKQRARDLQASAIRQIALEHAREVDAPALLAKPEVVEAAALVAYGIELVRRMDDAGCGPAALALWRAFAWTPQGSPKHGFELTPQLILDAETSLVHALRRAGGGATSGSSSK